MARLVALTGMGVGGLRAWSEAREFFAGKPRLSRVPPTVNQCFARPMASSSAARASKITRLEIHGNLIGWSGRIRWEKWRNKRVLPPYRRRALLVGCVCPLSSVLATERRGELVAFQPGQIIPPQQV